jgi:hypothetical protein
MYADSLQHEGEVKVSMTVPFEVDVEQLAAAKVRVGARVLGDSLDLLEVGTEPVGIVDAVRSALNTYVCGSTDLMPTVNPMDSPLPDNDTGEAPRATSLILISGGRTHCNR